MYGVRRICLYLYLYCRLSGSCVCCACACASTSIYSLYCRLVVRSLVWRAAVSLCVRVCWRVVCCVEGGG
jgi:hypothetical protein